METADGPRELAVELAADEVWRCLGPAGRAREPLADEVAHAVAEATRIGSPRAATRTLQMVQVGRGRVAFEDGIAIEGSLLPHLFEGADGAVFLLATAGPEIGQRVTELFAADRAVEAFVLDAAGSAVAMNAGTRMVAALADGLSGAGYRVGRCLVPGNEYWSLEGQRAIFQAVAADEIGVRLLGSLLMDPQKSQSSIIPFGRELRVLDDPSEAPCRRCKAVRCPMRLEEYDPSLEPAPGL